jgi:hypothetical protein
VIPTAPVCQKARGDVSERVSDEILGHLLVTAVRGGQAGGVSVVAHVLWLRHVLDQMSNVAKRLEYFAERYIPICGAWFCQRVVVGPSGVAERVTLN